MEGLGRGVGWGSGHTPMWNECLLWGLTHVSVFLPRRGFRSAPPIALGLLLWGVLSAYVCMQNTQMLLRFVGKDHLCGRWAVHGHLSTSVLARRPSPGVPLGCGAAVLWLQCLMWKWDRNHLSKQGHSVWWGLNIRISHHGEAVRDRALASGPWISLSLVAKVFWCQTQQY